MFPTPEFVAVELAKPDKEYTDFVAELGASMKDTRKMQYAHSLVDGITTYTLRCGENLSEYNQNKISSLLFNSGWHATFEQMHSQHSPSVTVKLQPTAEVFRDAEFRVPHGTGAA